MSAIGAECGWSLMGQSASANAVETALARQSEHVCYGSWCFEFSKTREAGGDIIVVLKEHGRSTKDGRPHPFAKSIPHPVRMVQRVSAVSRDLDEPTRARLEAKVVQVVGRTFFRHVAHLLDIEGV